ncbi:immunity protein YezG family protein [Listeria booriae]|uniref:DUF600 family protein n=1 Tax=Listeria booriae TaxID=1552123 RepID=A0A7X0XS46_9LIST|nr:immunity protein YezG family protein [Listeria booriae]MBC1779015.1 DUF600 family protein [Listeria booriae]MBC1889195.1 DUF600 family protein [Listeria booriae]
MERELNSQYKKIAELVNKMIPEPWEIIHLYAQISDTGGGVYFYYKSEQYEDYVYSLELTKLYNINKAEHDKNEYELYKLAKKLQAIFKENNQEPWYSFTMSLQKNGKFKMHFDYTNWFDTEYSFSDQMIIWKYKYLDEKPQDQKLQQIIDKYLLEYPKNPI